MVRRPQMCNCTRCAIAHRGSPGFRVHRCTVPRNDISIFRHRRPGFISAAALNFAVPCADKPEALRASTGENTSMKIALLIVLGLVLGALGGAALGIGAGLAWVEIFQTSSFEGDSGMLVFFSFMPL